MQCPQCDSTVLAGARFCTRCGTQVPAASAAAETIPSASRPPAGTALTDTAYQPPATPAADWPAAPPRADPSQETGYSPSAASWPSAQSSSGQEGSYRPSRAADWPSQPPRVGPGQQAGAAPYRSQAAYPPAARAGGAIVAGVLAILGAIGVVVALFVPVISSQGAFTGATFSNTIFKQLKDPAGLRWFLVEPFGVALIAIVVGVIVMAARGRTGPKVAGGILMGIGFQTVLFFLGEWRGYILSTGESRGPAGMVGVLAGAVMVVAGLIAAAAGAARR